LLTAGRALLDQRRQRLAHRRHLGGPPKAPARGRFDFRQDRRDQLADRIDIVQRRPDFWSVPSRRSTNSGNCRCTGPHLPDDRQQRDRQREHAAANHG